MFSYTIVCGAPDVVLVAVVTRDFINRVVKQTLFGAGDRAADDPRA